MFAFFAALSVLAAPAACRSGADDDDASSGSGVGTPADDDAATAATPSLPARATEVFIGHASVVRGVKPPPGPFDFIALDFRTCKANGLILVQEGVAAGTFVWISLTDTSLVVRWNLGYGVREQVDSLVNLADCQWHRVNVQLTPSKSSILITIDGRDHTALGRLETFVPADDAATAIGNVGDATLEQRQQKPWGTQKPLLGCVRDVQLGNSSALPPVVNFADTGASHSETSFECTAQKLLGKQWGATLANQPTLYLFW